MCHKRSFTDIMRQQQIDRDTTNMESNDMGCQRITHEVSIAGFRNRVGPGMWSAAFRQPHLIESMAAVNGLWGSIDSAAWI